MDVQLITDGLAGACGFNRIDVADHIGHSDIRRRQFLDVTIFAGHPGDGRFVAERGDFVSALGADRAQRVVADFTTGDVRHLRIKQPGQHAREAGFGLPTQAEQDEVVT